MTRPGQLSRSVGCYRREANGGYLLVEVLATMTVSAFILAALLSIVSFTLRTSAHVSRQTQDIENASRVMASLVREIQAIAPLRWAGQNAGFVFQGREQGLVFAREVVAPDGAVDDRAVLLQGDGKQLFRSEASLLPAYRSAAEIAAGEKQALLDTDFQVRFAYFARLEDGQEALTNTWDNPALLPVAIRVSITDSKGALIGSSRVQIRVDAEPGCAAPTKALCNFAADRKTDDGQPPETETPVDADDSRGWERYAK
jgi:hypothetical protein